jgi:large conductance mechanosensitive channel
MSLKSTMTEFKEFAVKGNVVDMAVGVIIGGAFGKIVTSLVNDIVMPVIGVLTGGIDFTNLFVPLDGNTYATLAEAEEAGAAVLKYGSFISQILDFLIIAFVIFIIVKKLMNMKKKPEPAPEAPTTKVCPYCKSEISIEATRCPHCTSQLD